MNWLADNDRLEIIATLADHHIVQDGELRTMAEAFVHESGLAEALEPRWTASQIGQVLVEGARGFAARSSSGGAVSDLAQELEKDPAAVLVVARQMDEVGDLAGRVFCGDDPMGRVIKGRSWQVVDQLVALEAAAELRRCDIPG